MCKCCYCRLNYKKLQYSKSRGRWQRKTISSDQAVASCVHCTSISHTGLLLVLTLHIFTLTMKHGRFSLSFVIVSWAIPVISFAGRASDGLDALTLCSAVNTQNVKIPDQQVVEASWRVWCDGLDAKCSWKACTCTPDVFSQNKPCFVQQMAGANTQTTKSPKKKGNITLPCLKVSNSRQRNNSYFSRDHRI